MPTHNGTLVEPNGHRVILNNHEPQFVRSPDGWIGGVCRGLGESFDMAPFWLRVAWILSIFVFGVGFGLYLILWITLPRKDHWQDVENKKILGVCRRLARKLDMEIGVVRALALLSLFLSGFTSVFIYFVLHFFLNEPSSGVRSVDGQRMDSRF